MNWVAACLRNKLIIYICSIALVCLGVFLLFKRPISPFPEIPVNMITIGIFYPGANAQTMDKQVTSPLIANLRAMANVQYINSYTQAGGSNILIHLNDMDPLKLLETQMNVIEIINAAHLPSSIPQPTVTIVKGQSDLLSYVVSSNEFDVFYLSNFISSVLIPKFNSLPGVQIRRSGLRPAVKIQLKPESLALYHLDPQAIANSINLNYQSAPLGSLYLNKKTYVLDTVDNYDSLVTLQNLIVGYQKPVATQNLVKALAQETGTPIYLKDIATLSFQPLGIEDTTYVNYNGKVAASFQLQTTTGANPFQITDAAEKFVKNLKATLPGDITITPLFKMSDVMSDSLHEVIKTILIACLLVFLVALVFLGRLKTTMVPIVAVPICLLGSILAFTIFDFSLNILTLLAMVIAVGLVVDDAIVVIENITRYIEQGCSKYDAVLQGTASIAKTIVGITLTLVAVYLPMTFVHGNMAVLFRAFALTLAAAVLISGVVALTLTPVLAMQCIDDRPPNSYQRWFDCVLHKIIDAYQSLLKKIFNQPFLALSVILVLIALSAYLVLKIPAMVFPPDPEGSVRVTIQGTMSDNKETLKNKAESFAQFYQDPKVSYYFLSVDKDPETGLLEAQISIQYKDQYLTRITQFEEQINTFITKQNLKNTFAKSQKFLNWGDDSFDITYYIYSNQSQDIINSEASAMTAELEKSPMFSIVSNTINPPQKELAFNIDTVTAQNLGISREQILQQLSTLYSGYQMTDNFSINGLSVPIVMQLDKDNLMDPNSYQKIMVHSNKTNKDYLLSNFVSLKILSKPQLIVSYNGMPTVLIQTRLAKGVGMAEGIAWVNHFMQTQYPQLQFTYVDQAKYFLESNNQTWVIAIFGLLAVYFLLTILFKSLIDPFIIMLTVPFTVLGGALSLYLIPAGSLNIFSVLGLITLIGLITKHGILIVQFANMELEQGASVLNAILSATRHRFRPIIMTTLAMIFGALPLLLSQKIMFVSRENLAITIIGGLIIGTFFSLFIVPLVYLLIKRSTNDLLDRS